MANFDSEFFGLVFSRVSGHPKNSRPKFTSRIVGIPLQFHLLEPKIYSRRFSAYGGDQSLRQFRAPSIPVMYETKCKHFCANLARKLQQIYATHRSRTSRNCWPISLHQRTRVYSSVGSIGSVQLWQVVLVYLPVGKKLVRFLSCMTCLKPIVRRTVLVTSEISVNFLRFSAKCLLIFCYFLLFSSISC